MLNAQLARRLPDLTHRNTLAVQSIPLRFQLAPGNASGLGVANVPYTISFGGLVVTSAETNADGEVSVPLPPLLSGAVTVRIFETDYEISLHPGLQVLTHIDGRQKRLESLGYMSGYLVDRPLGRPDSGNDNSNTQQAIMNLQTDQAVAIDGVIGPQTEGRLKTAVGV